MLVKFSLLAGGVFIEVHAGREEYQDDDRCFRFDDMGRAEYALYGDLISGNPSPRWYHHQFNKTDFIFA